MPPASLCTCASGPSYGSLCVAVQQPRSYSFFLRCAGLFSVRLLSSSFPFVFSSSIFRSSSALFFSVRLFIKYFVFVFHSSEILISFLDGGVFRSKGNLICQVLSLLNPFLGSTSFECSILQVCLARLEMAMSHGLHCSHLSIETLLKKLEGDDRAVELCSLLLVATGFVWVRRQGLLSKGTP